MLCLGVECSYFYYLCICIFYPELSFLLRLNNISVNAHFKKNVLKIVLIIVNINKDENKSLISNQFSLKNDFSPISWRTILRR
jgi:hypothetical protein